MWEHFMEVIHRRLNPKALIYISAVFYLSSHLESARADPLAEPLERAQIMSVLSQNLNAIKTRNASEVMSTLSIQCPAYKHMRRVLPQLLARPVRFSLIKREILSISAQEALVQEELEVKAAHPDVLNFQDHRSITRSKLIKELSGQWKLCNTEVKAVTYLDKQERSTITRPAEFEVLKVMNDNFQGMKTEDLKRVLTTVSPKCAAYQGTQRTASQLFASYDIVYELLERRVVSIDQKNAQVLETVTARKIKGGSPFKNNQATVVSLLLRDETGMWKICESKIKRLEYID